LSPRENVKEPVEALAPRMKKRIMLPASSGGNMDITEPVVSEDVPTYQSTMTLTFPLIYPGVCQFETPPATIAAAITALGVVAILNSF
jgi:hypothetical protein